MHISILCDLYGLCDVSERRIKCLDADFYGKYIYDIKFYAVHLLWMN